MNPPSPILHAPPGLPRPSAPRPRVPGWRNRRYGRGPASLAAAVAAGVLGLGAAARAQIVLSDADFPDAGWTTTKFRDTTPGSTATVTSLRQPSGGASGAYQEVTFVLNGGDVYGAHVWLGLQYDPATSGAVASMNWSADVRGDPTFPTGPSVSVLVKQDGLYFGYWAHSTAGVTWTSVSDANLTAADLFLLPGQSGPAQPDFSASGSALGFGFCTGKQEDSSGPYTLLVGVDNWRVELTSVPEPSLWAVVAGFALVGWRLLAPRRLAFAALALLLAQASPRSAQAGLRLPLEVRDFSGVERVGEPVRSGVPIPRSLHLYDTTRLRLAGPSGQPVPARIRVLGRWGAGPNDTPPPPDDSQPIEGPAGVRWLLLEFPADVPASGSTTYTLSDDGGGPVPPSLEVVESPSEIAINTGPARFLVTRSQGTLLEVAWLDLNGDARFAPDEQILVPAEDSGPFVTDARTEYRGRATAPISVAVEDRGPGRITVRAEGFHQAPDGTRLLRYLTRLTFFAGRSQVHVHHTLIEGRVAGNGNGDLPGGQQVTPFESAGLRWKIRLADAGTVQIAGDSPGPLILPLTSGADFASVRQRTPTHFTNLLYEVDRGTESLGGGERAREAHLELGDDRWGLSVATRDFHRKGPQRLSAQGDGTLVVEFPSEPYTIYQAMGLAEEVLLDFHPANRGFATAHADVQGWLRDPLFALAPAAWYCSSGVFGELTPAPSRRYPRYDAILEEHYRETLDWIESGRCFGLLNYLDLPSDQYETNTDPHRVFYGNSYYDAPTAQVREFARRGEFRWLRNLAFPNIRHWYTTDCYDTNDPDHPYNGISTSRGTVHRDTFSGQYHYMESLWDYYYLTGDPRALERGLAAARSYAFRAPWRNDFDLGGETGPGIPGRVLAQKFNTLLEAYLASGDESLRVALSQSVGDYLAVVATPEGFFRAPPGIRGPRAICSSTTRSPSPGPPTGASRTNPTSPTRTAMTISTIAAWWRSWPPSVGRPPWAATIPSSTMAARSSNAGCSPPGGARSGTNRARCRRSAPPPRSRISRLPTNPDPRGFVPSASCPTGSGCCSRPPSATPTRSKAGSMPAFGNRSASCIPPRTTCWGSMTSAGVRSPRDRPCSTAPSRCGDRVGDERSPRIR